MKDQQTEQPQYYDPHYYIRSTVGKCRWYPFMTKELYKEFEDLIKK